MEGGWGGYPPLVFFKKRRSRIWVGQKIQNFDKIGKNYISYFLDTTLDKQNKYTPGTKIPIYKYESINNKNIDFIFLGAWNFKDEIFKKEKKFIKKGGKFIMHTPYPRIIWKIINLNNIKN